ncbi:MAG: DUF1461 domain-containing protein, partial [Armatimonadetes bacterium]|nr:DUF1461 domain-containing protein [Anaerolineae bacterium]
MVNHRGIARSIMRPLLIWGLALLIPVLLVLGSVRLVMTPQFLQLEYQRPGFPEDSYGFTTADRLYYAPFAIAYLLNDAPLAYLGDLTFADGAQLYQASELQHMADVKTVTRTAFAVLLWGSLGAVLVIALLWTRDRSALALALLRGGLLTVGGIVVIVFGVIIAWDSFFTTFHQLFFQDGTWI